MSAETEPDDEYPQWSPDGNGLCYCELCHVQGAKWRFRGKDYHDDCAAKVMQRLAG